MAQFPAEMIRAMRAIEGDAFPGRAACQVLAQRLRAGELTHPEDVDYLAKALEAVAAGDDANTALRLKRDRKRPGKLARDLWIFERVEELRGTGKALAEIFEVVGLELQSYGEFKARPDSPVEDVGKIYRRMRKAADAED